MLFVHNDNNSNSGQIGQVVAMGGSGKTQDFFLCLYLALHKVGCNYLEPTFQSWGSHLDFTYNQNVSIVNKLFTILSNSNFAHTSLGHLSSLCCA